VAPAAGVFVALDVVADVDGPACEQAASNRIMAKKEIIRRTGCIYLSFFSL
jgi:hypothetical protein